MSQKLKLTELSKNIWVRLATLAAVLAIGTFAIIQSTGISPPTASITNEKEVAKAEETPTSGLNILPDPEQSTGDFRPVVRGNDGGSFTPPPSTGDFTIPPATGDFTIPPAGDFSVPAADSQPKQPPTAPKNDDGAFKTPPDFSDADFKLPPISNEGGFQTPPENSSVAEGVETAKQAAPNFNTESPATTLPPATVATDTSPNEPPTFELPAFETSKANEPAAGPDPGAVNNSGAIGKNNLLPAPGETTNTTLPAATNQAIPPVTATPPATTSTAGPLASVHSARPATTVGAYAAGNAEPGDPALEGPQTPSLSIVKLAPREIQVGKPAIFEVRVQNSGSVAAQGVSIIDRVPRGVKYMESNPPAKLGADGELRWTIGELKPGAQQTVSVQYLPLEEGEVGSVAVVTASTQASARTVCTRPLLQVEQIGPARVLVGDNATILIKISNPGTGAAYNVRLEEDVPAQLTHPAGKELESSVGTLKPGETRELELVMQASKAGKLKNELVVRGEGSLIAKHSLPMEVIAPDLKTVISGPGVRYLQREATYKIDISNPGTAAAKDVEITARLPRGLKFLSTNNAGQYDAREHAVRWSLVELPTGQKGTVEIKVLPIETNAQKIRVEGAAQLGVTHVAEHTVDVKAVAELFFEVTDQADPIEVGSDTIYTIRIVNHGAAAAENVVVEATFPTQLQPLGGEGPTRFATRGNQIVFEPLAQIAPKGEVTFRVQAKGAAAGDHRVRVSVASKTSAAVGKEENTRVYADR